MILHLLKTKYLYYSFFISLFSFSQQYTIKGQLNDTKNNPVVYANVSLIDSETDILIDGTTTNDSGNFLFTDIEKGTYLLKISFLGFKKYSKDIVLESAIDLRIISLEEDLQELEGVTVVAKRPTVTRLVDRLVFNVENSTLSNGNVLDVLKQTPGVLVHNESITIRNTEPVVYINDRRIHLSQIEVQQLLEGTSANSIKSIEVIKNPPAKYEAEGGSVLNIITNKNIIAGYNGSVFGNYKQGFQFPKYSLGTSHFFKTKKLNTYINYNVSPKKDFRNNDEALNFIVDNDVVSRWRTDYKSTRATSNHSINANIDYDIDENNVLSFSTNVLIAPEVATTVDINSFTEIYNANRELDSTFRTLSNANGKTLNLGFTLNYNHRMKNEGENIAFSIHHTNYDNTNFQNIDTDYFLPDESFIRNNNFETLTNQTIKLYTGQVDYALPLDETSLFETGGKISHINSENIQDQFTVEGSVRRTDLNNSDVFLYDETNYALYASYSKDWEKWRLKLGLRTEFTDLKGESVTTNAINNTDYMKLFPSLFLFNTLNEDNEIYFSFDRRIFRPRYKQLNPFRFFLNDNAYVTGDPNLQPQIDNDFTIGYTFKGAYTLEAYYSFQTNSPMEIIFQDTEENILKYTNTNIDRNVFYGLEFSTYTPIKGAWNVYLLAAAFYFSNEFTALESNNVIQNNGRWSFYSQFMNYFTLLKDGSLNLDVSFLYFSKAFQGATLTSAFSGLDINLRKTFWDNRASLSIGVNDIYNGSLYNETIKYLNQDIFIDTVVENRLFTLGFNYKFGNYRLRNNAPEEDEDLNERERLE